VSELQLHLQWRIRLAFSHFDCERGESDPASCLSRSAVVIQNNSENACAIRDGGHIRHGVAWKQRFADEFAGNWRN